MAEQSSDGRILRVSDIAYQYQLDPSQVYSFIRKDGLPAIRLGKRGIRVREADLLAWIKARTVVAVNEQ